MTSVYLRSNESQEQLLRRFRKKVAKSGVLSTVRRKRWFVSKSELRRIQKKKAIRRHTRKQPYGPDSRAMPSPANSGNCRKSSIGAPPFRRIHFSMKVVPMVVVV